MIDKIKAVIFGHAIGDALGVPVEFASRAELDNNPITEMEGNGTYPVPKGSWSDDTSMSLATLASLANGLNYEDIMSKFCQWINEAKYTPTGLVFDIGRATMKSLLSYDRNEAPAIECGQKSERDNGNGSLMRIHPVVLYLYKVNMPIEDKIEIVHNVSALTHAHIRSKIACGIYAFVLWEILSNPSKDAILEGLSRAKLFYLGEDELTVYARLFDKTFVITKRELIKSSGYVVDTLEAALWCVLTTNNYRDAVLKAVNLGEDTDTIAAITGGLAGAIYGYENIPKEWLNELLKGEYIDSLCNGLKYFE